LGGVDDRRIGGQRGRADGGFSFTGACAGWGTMALVGLAWGATVRFLFFRVNRATLTSCRMSGLAVDSLFTGRGRF
jgi:hypothetical protein